MQRKNLASDHGFRFGCGFVWVWFRLGFEGGASCHSGSRG